MKKAGLVIFILGVVISVTAQGETKAKMQQAYFKGGDSAMAKFIQKNLKYPAAEKQAGTGGIVLVGFTVNGNGSISEVKIEKGIMAALDSEAVRIVRIMPKFIPAKLDGIPTQTHCQIPVEFKIADKKDLSMEAEMHAKEKIDTNFRNAVTALGRSDFDNAIAACQKSLANKKDGLGYYILSVCYRQKGDTKNSCLYLKKASSMGIKQAGIDLKESCK